MCIMTKRLQSGIATIVTLAGLAFVAGCPDDDTVKADAARPDVGVEICNAVADAGLAKPTPLPEVAKGPAVDTQKGYLVGEIRDGLYWFGNGISQAMFLVTPAGVVLVDAPQGAATQIKEAIESVSKLPISHIVYSHSHRDHIGGVGPLVQAMSTPPVIVAHRAVEERLVEAKDPLRPVPTQTFDGGYDLMVGGKTLRLDYHGPQHEPGNIYIYAPAQKTLMVVDVVYPGWVPFKELGLAEDIPAYLRAPDDMLAYDFDVFVGGHVGRLGTRQDVISHQQYVASLVKNAMTATATGGPMGGAAAAMPMGGDLWFSLDLGLKAAARVCAELTTAEWRGRLGGVDAFTESHCDAVIDSLRID